jgi:hypothetical protein
MIFPFPMEEAVTWLGRVTRMFLLCGWSLGCSPGIAYRFVDTLSAAGPSPAPPLGTEKPLLGALDAASIEPAVYHLAAPEMEGRGRGTPGNARARAYIVSRLENAGLTPLFDGAFEQPTFLEQRGGAPYAVNVGAYLPAARPTTAWIVLVAHYDHLGVRSGKVYPGADDNASAVAMLLALGDALGRVRPPLRHHVVLLFPDAEEPPNIRTDRMGSAWFWRHPPFPLATLHCALVFDLLVGPGYPVARETGLADTIFVLGAEASSGLARLARCVPLELSMKPLLLSLPLIEAYPFIPWRRFAQSDYHGLRELGRRPFLFITAGRASTYHTAEDTPDRLDYAKLARLTRWVARLLVHAAEEPGDPGWTDMVADPMADARAALRLYAGIESGSHFPWILRRALAADHAHVQTLLHTWETGAAPTAAEYRELTLMALRLQAALWDPSGWWFALW